MSFQVTWPFGHRILGCLLFMAFVSVVSDLVIVGYLHRDNNYGVRQGDYQIRAISSDKFAELAPEYQSSWIKMPDSDAYINIIIRNPFVFSHVSNALIPMLGFTIAALAFYARTYGSNPKTPEHRPKPGSNPVA